MVSILPGAGDAVAKPLALAKTISKAYPWADRLEPDQLLKTLTSVNETSALTDVPGALRSLNNLQEAAEKVYRKEPKSAELASSYSLPTRGPLVFAPPEGWGDSRFGGPRGARGGFLDAFGNEWVSPRGRTSEPAFAVYSAKPCGLSSFAAAGQPIYVDARGLVVTSATPQALGHDDPIAKPTPTRLKA